MLSFWKSHQNFYRMHITTLLFPYCLPIRSTKFLTGNLVDIHPPDLDVQDSRTTIGKRTVGVLFHQDIERLDFLVVILFKNDISPTDNAAGPHPVTARHLYILIGQFGCRTKRNTNTRIPVQDRNASAFLSRMQVKRSVFVTKIHRDHIRRSIGIRHSHETNTTLFHYRFDLFVVNMYQCLHIVLNFNFRISQPAGRSTLINKLISPQPEAKIIKVTENNDIG